jgi:hypothetical protein
MTLLDAAVERQLETNQLCATSSSFVHSNDFHTLLFPWLCIAMLKRAE